MQNGTQRQMDTHTKAKLLETCSDELERLVLEEVHRRRRSGETVSALVLPVGHGELALELARLGCGVTGVDAAPFEEELAAKATAAKLACPLIFVPMNGLASPPETVPGEPFDIVFCRRGLCSMPYGQARQVVRKLLQKLKIGGKLYISILGMHSELGDHYPGNEKPIEDRFCELEPGMAKKYGIDHPVCLYSERNLFMLLLEAGGSVLRTFTTTHGNVKGVAVRV